MPLAHLKRTVEVATPGTKLSVSLGQLVVNRPGTRQVQVPIEEIGMLIIDDVRAYATQSVYIELLNSGGCVLISNASHLPVGMMMPIDGHSTQVQIQRSQISMTKPQQKRLWQRIVREKVRQQSRVLTNFNNSDYGLSKLAKRVLSGDASNIEAQAARKYWARLFGKRFRRDRTWEGLNALLNYGYAVVRATVARAIVASGLLPTIGIHHHNRSNPFCLADDLLEPFRPFVDWRVKSIALSNQHDSELCLQNRTVRAELLSLLNVGIRINDRTTPLSLAISISATSLRDSIIEQEDKLVFPKGLPDTQI
ncbi:MAG: type II CRISPR-associated endonuclease Cas1 [Gammaproteobacteria bacterium]|nr:type II CRISPR-associated endonuclease Cas1 [Gammaproteobacteria bacterium]